MADFGGMSREKIEYAIKHHEYKGIISFKAPTLLDLENKIRFNPNLDFEERREGYKEIAMEEYKKFLVRFKNLPILFNHQSNDNRPPGAPVVYPMGLTTKVELHENGTMCVFLRPFDNSSGRAMVSMIEGKDGPHGLSLHHLHNYEEVQPLEISICYVGKRDESGVISIDVYPEGLEPLPLSACVPVVFPPSIKITSYPYRTSQDMADQKESSSSSDKSLKVSVSVIEEIASSFADVTDPRAKELLAKLNEATRPDDLTIISNADAIMNKSHDSVESFKDELFPVVKDMSSRLTAYDKREKEQAQKVPEDQASAAKNLELAYAGKGQDGQVPLPIRQIASIMSSPGRYMEKKTMIDFLNTVNASLSSPPVSDKASADTSNKSKRKMDFDQQPPAKKDSKRFSLLENLIK